MNKFSTKKNIVILGVVLVAVIVVLILSNQLSSTLEKVSKSTSESIGLSETKEQEPDQKQVVSVAEVNKEDWLDYKSEDVGFEIKYPTNWIAQEQDSNINFVNPEASWPSQDSISMTISLTDKSLEEFIEEYNNSDIIEGGLALSTIIKEVKVIVDNFS